MFGFVEIVFAYFFTIIQIVNLVWCRINKFSLIFLDLRIHCPGNPGHGSLLLDDTAGEKVRIILDRLFTFRDQEKKKLHDNPSLTIGDVTTVNLTQMKVCVPL